jgi:hypothetical protein
MLGGENMNFIEKLKKIKLKLIIIISVVILCLVFGIVGIVRYTNAVQAKEGLVLGNKYLQEEKYEEAILAFIKVIKIEPKNIEARVGLAKAYIKNGKHDEAEKILKESISINPKKVEPYLELARLYIIENKPINAIKTLTDGYKATNDERIKSLLEDIKSKITVDNIDKTITLGENYSLPKEVAVKINNVEVQFPVKWDRTSVDTTKIESNTFTGILENTDKALKLTLKVITVASIENINSTINQNNKYSLPSKVTAKMTDGSAREVDVTWNPSTVDTSKAGSYTYQGTVSGYDNKIGLILNVITITSVENLNSTINQNDKYSLPPKVTAKMTDGSTRDVAVTWNPSGVDSSKAGSYSYEGTVSRYNTKIKLTLNIKAEQKATNFEEVFRNLLGQPSSKLTEKFGKYISETMSPSYESVIEKYSDFYAYYRVGEGNIYRFSITNPKITVSGLNCGMSGDEVINKLGKPKYIIEEDDSGSYIWENWYKYDNIQFFFSDGSFNKIKEIAIF